MFFGFPKEVGKGPPASGWQTLALVFEYIQKRNRTAAMEFPGENTMVLHLPPSNISQAKLGARKKHGNVPFTWFART